MNLLKKLVDDWRNEAKGPTMASSKIGRETLARCAFELESLIKGTEALGKFRPGSGVGLPHGTIAWVLFDGTRYIREWHPMQPDADGAPKGNWWPLDNSFSGRFSEHEVTHYSVIEVPDAPGAAAPPPVSRNRLLGEGFTAVVGRNYTNTSFLGYAMVPHGAGAPMLITVEGQDEGVVLQELAERCDMVLKTFFMNYRVVKL